MSEQEAVASYIDERVDRSKDALVIIDCLPTVDPAKLEKLKAVLAKKIREKTEKEATFIHMPQDDDLTTLGFCFAAFPKKQDAEEVVRRLHGLKFDKNHVLRTNLFTEWDKIKDTPDVYANPSLEMDKFNEEPLYEYLCDDTAREQYFIRHAMPGRSDDHTMGVFWNDYQVTSATDLQPSDIMKKVYEKSNWTKLFAAWSPLGTYLVTFTEKGINLWGGKNWTKMGQFSHNEVQNIDWSPKEKYLITWSSELIVWDVQLGKKIRRFQVPYTGDTQWPFKWSHDEQFLAKLSTDNILLYDLEQGMKLYQPDPERTTTIYKPGIKSLEWSPTENYFCYWVPEANNTPARVTLVEVETVIREGQPKGYKFNTIAQRNLYKIEDIRMTWHPQGDFLACKVQRKSKSAYISAYELFRIRHKDVAVETIELQDTVVAFSFEPRGHRFALIHGPSDVKLNVSFYTMGAVKSGEVRLLKTFHNKQVNHIYWSPKGKYLLLAGMKQPFNGNCLEFWNADELELINTTSHFMCSNANWDASGRFITTFVSQHFHQMENGFKIWTFQGKLAVEKKIEKFYQFMWRPRPPTLVTDKDTKQIVRNKKNWEKKFADEEVRILKKDEIERKERMSKMFGEYKTRVSEIRKVFKDHAVQRKKLQASTGVDFDFETRTITSEELVDTKEVKV